MDFLNWTRKELDERCTDEGKKKISKLVVSLTKHLLYKIIKIYTLEGKKSQDQSW